MMEMVRKKGLDLFKYSTFWKGVKFGRSVNDKQMHGNRVQKSRRRQECQELTSKMCWPNIESGPSALTLMFHIRPSPMYVSVSVKLQSHCWVCDETKQAILIVNLADFLVGTHKRAYVNMWHENVAGSLETPSCFMDVLHSSHHTCARMSQLARFRGTFCHVACSNIWTKQDMVTYELPCAHDKCSQIARQKRVSVLVAAQARWQFCSLRHTLRACACVKHECLCSMLSIDVVPALIFF